MKDEKDYYKDATQAFWVTLGVGFFLGVLVTSIIVTFAN